MPSYDVRLIEEGLCPELVWIDTEDGRVDGRCMAPIVPGGCACPGHQAEIDHWRSMSEIDKADWERRQDEEPW